MRGIIGPNWCRCWLSERGGAGGLRRLSKAPECRSQQKRRVSSRRKVTKMMYASKLTLGAALLSATAFGSTAMADDNETVDHVELWTVFVGGLSVVWAGRVLSKGRVLNGKNGFIKYIIDDWNIFSVSTITLMFSRIHIENLHSPHTSSFLTIFVNKQIKQTSNVAKNKIA